MKNLFFTIAHKDEDIDKVIDSLVSNYLINNKVSSVKVINPYGSTISELELDKLKLAGVDYVNIKFPACSARSKEWVVDYVSNWLGNKLNNHIPFPYYNWKSGLVEWPEKKKGLLSKVKKLF